VIRWLVARLPARRARELKALRLRGKSLEQTVSQLQAKLEWSELMRRDLILRYRKIRSEMAAVEGELAACIRADCEMGDVEYRDGRFPPPPEEDEQIRAEGSKGPLCPGSSFVSH